MRFSILAAAITAVLSLSTRATAEDYVIDPVHSSVIFKVSHVGASEFIGRFNQISGEIVFDEKNLAESRVKATVPAASIDTNNAQRDQHVRSADFLHAEEHPQIVFEGKGFEKAKGKDTWTVKGKMTLRGITRDLEVTVRKLGVGEYPEGVQRIGFITTFKIKRSDYGIPFPAAAVGDEVELTVAVEGMIPKKEPPKQ